MKTLENILHRTLNGRQRTDDVFCAFFTDQAGLDNETSSSVRKESQENNDLVFLEVEGKSDVVVSMRS